MTSVSSLLGNHRDNSKGNVDSSEMQQRSAGGAMKQHTVSTPAQHRSASVCLPYLPCCCWPELESGGRVFWVLHAHAESKEALIGSSKFCTR